MTGVDDCRLQDTTQTYSISKDSLPASFWLEVWLGENMDKRCVGKKGEAKVSTPTLAALLLLKSDWDIQVETQELEY